VKTLNWFLRKTRYSAPLLWIGAVAVAAAIAQSTATLIQIVNKSTPTVTATSSLNPSVFGTSITFSASLTAALADNATGTVQWMDGATPIGSPVPVASAGASMPFLFSPREPTQSQRFTVATGTLPGQHRRRSVRWSIRPHLALVDLHRSRLLRA